VHDDGHAQEAAAAFNAQAFTLGTDIYFGRWRFDPATTAGRHLLAHELAHTVQGRPPASARGLRRQEAVVLPPTGEADSAATTIVQAIRENNLSNAVPPLRAKSIGELQSIRTLVHGQTDVWLEHWLAQRLRAGETLQTAARLSSYLTTTTVLSVPARIVTAGATARPEEGLRLLWPAIPLVDRLLVYDEGYRELEAAQIDVIRAATRDQRDAAKGDSRLHAIYEAMSAREEYDARVLIDPSEEGLVTAAGRALARGDEDVVFDALLALPPQERQKFVSFHTVDLYRLLYNWQFDLVLSMAREITVRGRTFGGNEVDALIARLKLATISRSDDMAGVQAVVDRAVALFRERQQIRALAQSPGLPVTERERLEQRLQELEGLDRLLTYTREDGELAGGTFLALIADARGDAVAFGADAQRFAEFIGDPEGADRFAFETAKQRILMTGDDREGLQATFLTIHAPPVRPEPGATRGSIAVAQHRADLELRNRLLEDDQVKDVMSGLTGFERDVVLRDVQGDAFNEILYRLSVANRSANWGEFFRLTLQIARNPEWKARYQATQTDPWGTYASVHGERREIMLEILASEPPRMPLGRVLRFTGNVASLRAAFSEIPEADREQLRRGWALARGLGPGGPHFIGPPSPADVAALEAFRQFAADLMTSQTTLGIPDLAGFEAVLSAALGTEPTAAELETPEGRYAAAALMYERQEQQLALDRGGSAFFTETDETMIAAAREFAALWLRVKDEHRLSMTDYAALVALHQRFLSRTDEFTAASNAIGELAAMVASTVAGIVVVVATGGAATPAVIALAAASGAGARVITREMFGGAYYDALSSDAARQALLGAIDGALAVVSARLAARGAELIGLGGRSLASGASRVAGLAAEEATETLGQKVAAGGVEAAIDGLLSGAVTEALGAFTDERTWRRGIMDGLVRVGEAALLGGLVGLGTGGIIGAVAPLVGAGASRLWEGIVGQSVEKTLIDVGAGETLTAARAAAAAQDLGSLNRLSLQLEAHLNVDQAAALRRQLYDEYRRVAGHPPGTARAATPEQEQLLNASGRLDEGLSDLQKQAEHDIVRRSQPQRSTEAGYVDEVDLGNGHTWRRRADGTWCRFTKTTDCGTVIRGAATMPRGTATQIAATEARLQGAVATAEQRARVLSNYEDILRRASESRPRGQRTINVDALTAEEQKVLSDLFEEDLEELTPAALRSAFTPPTRRVPDPRGGPVPVEEPTGAPSAAQRLQQRSAEEVVRLQTQLRELSQSLYDRLRAVSPRSMRDTILKRAGNRDEISGVLRKPADLEIDHVVPLREIVDMPNFAVLADLDYAAAKRICDYADNLRAIDALVNSHRQNRSWAEPFTHRDRYTYQQLQDIIAHEEKMRGKLQELINQALDDAKRGVGR
jgi:hypothetical protein